MNSILYELQAAEAHWHDLQVEAEHERLAQEALRARAGDQRRSPLARLLDVLKHHEPEHERPNPSRRP